MRALHERDLREGYGEVYIPEALARKYPNACREPGWQYVFPSKNRSVDPRSGKEMRHHVLESGLQKAVKTAVVRAGIVKRASCHTFRHSYATHLLEAGVNIRAVQGLMGHNDVKTTEIYTHVMNTDLNAVVSPLDRLDEMEKEEG
ncbi:MAG: tyrosine-type recombinase/integrase [Kiritimatiellae bacterium]|nr:tyrosine-type recombinase/integrase [Kiritimatiellia bacterium]